MKVRGFVRSIIGEIYYDDDLDHPKGGWVWIADVTAGDRKRGVSPSIYHAVRAVEEALGIT